MKWRSLRNSGTLFISFSLAACATTQSYKPVQLPAFAGAYFSECTGNDGSVSIEMFSEGKVQQIFDADWTSDANGDFGLASYSPLGQTLFQIDFVQKQDSFKQSGKPLPALEKLAVGKHKIVSLDGHEIGLRSDEVACFLNHKIPQRWLKKIVAETVTANEIQYTVVDSDRTIRLSLNKHGNRSEEYWKADINWSLYWGFKKMSLAVRLLRGEQALVLHSDQFDKVDCRIVSQEE
ncbi:MAG: hypothetical protein H7318_18370 [Oligoflexus sp.]|nr:hypothetical protein [Oligoflexus sp.]